MVWSDLESNPSLPFQWQTLHPLDHWSVNGFWSIIQLKKYDESADYAFYLNERRFYLIPVLFSYRRWLVASLRKKNQRLWGQALYPLWWPIWQKTCKRNSKECFALLCYNRRKVFVSYEWTNLLEIFSDCHLWVNKVMKSIVMQLTLSIFIKQ